MEDDIDALRWVESGESLFWEKGKGDILVEPKYKAIADLQGVLILSYFFVLSYFIPLKVTKFGLPLEIFRSIILPLILSLPWLLIYYLGINRWAKAFKIVDIIMSRVGNYYRVFYLANAIFLFLFFLIPVMTPLLSLVALFFLLVKMILFPKKKIVKFLTLAVLLSVYIAFIIFFYEEFIFIYFNFIIDDVFPLILQIWENNLYTIYILSLILASSSSLASFIRFIYEGASQIDASIRIPVRRIQFIQLVYVLTGVFLQFNLKLEVTLFLLAVTSLSVLEGFIRWVKKFRKNIEFFGAISRWVSWVVYITFILIEALRRLIGATPYLQILPIGLGALYFLAVFAYAFIKAG